MLLILAFLGEKRVAWAGRLRRVNPGSPTRAEWLGPDDVVECVRADYKQALRWLQDVALQEADAQLEQAADYLTGEMLKTHTERLKRYHMYREKPLLFEGVLRADHLVDVRHFSADGEKCLVIDVQIERRMATYALQSGERVGTQHMEDATLVYQMAYDREAERWKISAFVQVLPSAWRKPGAAERVRIQPEIHTTAGRDY